MTTQVFALRMGCGPLVLSLPHVGTYIPKTLRHRYQPQALRVEDTDWHLERLYDFAQSHDATIIAARMARYVIDLNRPPDDAPMYPGASNTELCPTRFFTGESLYLEGQAPDKVEVLQRREQYWQPYHDQLRNALDQAKAKHGYAVLWDGHSIRSELPWLFDGKLPDFNMGTASGASCNAGLRDKLSEVLSRHGQFTHAVDGRFKGGYITRNYGRPEQGIHAIQMEMCQSLYMQERMPYAYLQSVAEQAQPVLREMFDTLLAWRPDGR